MKKIITLLLLIMYSSSQAEWHRGEAQEIFGPDTSERTACIAAENKAILNVLRQTVGESISASQFQMCNEMGEEVCQMLMSSSTYTEGLITGFKIRNTEVSGSGMRTCNVSVDVNITKDTGNADTSFDPEIRMSKTQLKDGEELKIIVRPNQPIFLNLFYFSPYLERHEQVQSFYQTNKMITEKIELPEPTKTFYATFPKIKVNGDIAGEMVIAVATKKPISFRKVFSFSEFNQRLQEIPKSERRVIKIPYFIWAQDNSHKLQ